MSRKILATQALHSLVSVLCVTDVRRKALQSSTAEENAQYHSLCDWHLQSPQRRERQETEQQIRRNAECRTDIKEIRNREALPLDGVIPRCVDRHAGKYNGEDRADPDTQDECDCQHNFAKHSLRDKDSEIGRHDGEFGEGYGCRVGEITSIECFCDSTRCCGELCKDRREVPDVFAETKAVAYETGRGQ